MVGSINQIINWLRGAAGEKDREEQPSGTKGSGSESGKAPGWWVNVFLLQCKFTGKKYIYNSESLNYLNNLKKEKTTTQNNKNTDWWMRSSPCSYVAGCVNCPLRHFLNKYSNKAGIWVYSFSKYHFLLKQQELSCTGESHIYI